MTQDYTRVGQKPESKPQMPSLAQHRAVILMSIYFSAALFFAAGVWLAIGGSVPFPLDQAQLLGYAFIVASVVDIAIAMFTKRYWEKADKSSTLSQT